MGLVTHYGHEFGCTFDDTRSVAPSDNRREESSDFDIRFIVKAFGDLDRVSGDKIRVVVLLGFLVEKNAQFIGT